MGSKTTEDLKEELKKTVELLRTLRDEARVKTHLAAMDVKAAWRELEPKINEAERLAGEAVETVSDATLQTIKSTANAVQKLVSSL